MPFVLSTKPTFFFTAKIPRPNDDKGNWDSFDLRVEFKRRTQPEIAELLKKSLPELQVIVIRDEFVGWHAGDLKDAEGKALEVNDSNRTLLRAEPFAEAAIFKAWWEASAIGPAKN